MILNNDHQRELKCSKEFQKKEERMIIVPRIKAMDQVILTVGEDRTVCATLEKIADEYGDSCNLDFASAGDQNKHTIPKSPICVKMRVTLIDE